MLLFDEDQVKSVCELNGLCEELLPLLLHFSKNN